MIDICKNSGKPAISPFQEEIALDNYFAGANRGNVLAQMKEALQAGVPLMVLTGEEGSGKTMLCRKLEHELAPHYQIVFFSRTVDSFEDVVRLIARRLGLDAVDGEVAGQGVDQALEQIIDCLLSGSQALLVIFDEAENMFLATLERIRKMLDRIVDAGAPVQLLFSGRETFVENCDQLSICDFQTADECRFALGPLSEADTADYLENRAALLTGMDGPEIFTGEVVAHISTLARGNFRMTNILGEEAVKIHGDGSSFMALLESVEGKTGDDGKESDWGKYSCLVRKVAGYLPWVGGGLGCLLLLFVLFGSGDDQPPVPGDIDQPELLETAVSVPEADVQLSEKAAPAAEQTAKNGEPAEETAALVPTPATAPSGEDFAVTATVEKLPRQYPGQLPTAIETITADSTMPAETTNNTAAAETVGTKTAEVGAEEDVLEAGDRQPDRDVVKSEAEDIAPLRAIQALKNKPGALPELSREIVTLRPRAKKQKTIVPTPRFPADKLYEERLSAGSGWQRAGKKKMYTVQLMALASRTAEQNLKKMLAEHRYRQEAGNFYIFKQTAASKNIFVFYGEYPTLERARLVRDSLPKFLRDHKPYALSIKGAIAKVRQ